MLAKQANEIIKCGESFPYFCETYVKILHPTKGYIPFKLQPWQERLAVALEENRFVIAKKWRQGGIATTKLIYCLWMCLFRENKTIMWIHKSKREAEWFSELFNLTLKLLPEWMRPRMTRNNKHEKTFSSTGSHICFWNPSAACGKTMTHLIIDEAAYIPRMEWHWKAMFPVLSMGGKCWISSTVNHGSNGLWFTETYIGAVKNTNCFYVFESAYKEHPDYQNPEYLRAIREALGKEGWEIEILATLFPQPNSGTLDADGDPTKPEGK
jgi:hypothetical protein